MNEEWRAIKGFNDMYEVSNIGRVRSHDWVFIDKIGRTIHRKGRVLKPFDFKGYKMVNLCENGMMTNQKIHRLVGMAFLPAPLPGQNQINHLDFNPSNNRVENLEWTTPVQNVQHSARAGRMSPATNPNCSPITNPKKNPLTNPKMSVLTNPNKSFLTNPNMWPNTNPAKRRKLTPADVNGIRVMKAHGYANSVIAKEFGITSGTVSHIMTGKTWRERSIP